MQLVVTIYDTTTKFLNFNETLRLADESLIDL